MAVRTIKIENVLGFRGRIEINFSDGINVLVGQNGTGKTSVLKTLYYSVQQTNGEALPGSPYPYYAIGLKQTALRNSFSGQEISFFEVLGEKRFFRVLFEEPDQSTTSIRSSEDWADLNISSIFVPTTEMLSHSKGLLALDKKYKNLPFDRTQIDILVNASLPEIRETQSYMQDILEKISDVIDGTVIIEDDVFYVLKKDGRKLDFSLEAEGLRKLGLLWKLIKNGLLEEGSILLWDEPEANLNPELFPLVADILLTLQENGVQIFVATHSYNFAKYLEIRRKDKEQVQFHNLYKENADGIETIRCGSAFRFADLKPNHIMMADVKLLDEVYELR